MTLKQYEGRDVVATTVKITGAGDGLSPALDVEPAEFDLDQRVCVVLVTTVGQIQHLPVKKGSKQLQRRHVLSTEQATIVDFDLVAEVLDEQQKKIEAAKGIQRLDGTDVKSTNGKTTAQRENEHLEAGR